tara:strand:+ start:201 stop:980 length:780 start_codon:yes stop_codon:yes gene_type:complete
MGKKITSSSPLDTLAFDAIPSTWQYSNAITKHSYTPSSPSYGGGASGGSPYTSTNTNTDLTGDEKPCPPGKHMGETGTCVKNKKTSRGSRLKKGIAEDEALGKTASAARKRKRLAGWQLGQEKRTKQIDESGKTFFGRLGSNIGDIFDPNAHKGTFDTKGKPEKYDKSRHDLKLERVENIKKEEGKVALAKKEEDCNKKQNKKWENGACVDLVTTNYNPVSTSSTNLSSITTGLMGTGIQPKSQKPCPKGQTRVGKFCI